jgi:tetratricopeptide (TPR) repeat protein
VELAEKAIALDEYNIFGLALLSHDEMIQKRFDSAIADGQRAVALDPNFAFGHWALANALTLGGNPQRGLAEAEKARRLDPSSFDFYGNSIALAYGIMGRFQEAIPLLKRYFLLEPNDAGAHLFACFVYAESGLQAEARAEAAEIMRISPQFRLQQGWGPTNDESWNKRFERDLHNAGLKEASSS